MSRISFFIISEHFTSEIQLSCSLYSLSDAYKNHWTRKKEQETIRVALVALFIAAKQNGDHSKSPFSVVSKMYFFRFKKSIERCFDQISSVHKNNSFIMTLSWWNSCKKNMKVFNLRKNETRIFSWFFQRESSWIISM